MGYYILEGQEPKHVSDTLVWAKWMETGDRRVKLERVGNYEISTVFLGLDHSFHRFTHDSDVRPILFETMVFEYSGADRSSVTMERCATWAEAEEQHDAIVRRYRVVVSG